MNTLDIIILIIILIPALLGLKNGLLRGIFSLIGIIAGLFLATKYTEQLASHLSFLKWNMKLINLISFVTIIVLTYLILIYIANKISGLNIFTKSIDKILGFGFGIFKGVIIASLFLLLTTNTFNFFSKETIGSSYLYSYVINAAPNVFNYIKGMFPNTQNFYEELKILLPSNVINL